MTEDISYHILSQERRKITEDVVNRAIKHINGSVYCYEQLSGREPKYTLTKQAKESWREYCKLVGKDEKREEKCQNDYEARAKKNNKSEVHLCWAGVHNAICPVFDNNDSKVTLLGGKFILQEKEGEAEERVYQFFNDIQLNDEQKDIFFQAWRKIPRVDDSTKNQILRELELAGLTYFYSLRQLSHFKYSVDIVSHDLIILLQNLIAEVDTLGIELKRTFNIGKAWISRFEDIVQSCEKYDSYLKSRLGAMGEPAFSNYPMAKLIYECVELHQNKARKRGIEFRVNLEKVQDGNSIRVPYLYMEKSYLNRAFHNVLDNAVKYSYDGTAQSPRWIDVTGKVVTMRGIPGYTVLIENEGIGIEADELDEVFTPGYQGRLRMGEFRPGFGMGLAFVKECVEIHNGIVSISSIEKGTVWRTKLTMWLPIEPPAE